ncbi:TNF receptor-associated factor 6-like [Ixodes scapularis]|uniref:TNF receptor-associated factor 6-like n=1 Tax=Ixodes scapularis TaxID=6945 RepID=UPI001C38A23E|nr:TNF receptor-associated factor 6-like [Ixodes scapularis]
MWGRRGKRHDEFCEVKGFWGLEGRFLRFPCDVLDKAECDHCKCIPKEVYYLRCLKHQLCLGCKYYCQGYYCNKCDVHTSPKELLDVPRSINYEAKHLRVLCPFCDVEMRLEWIESHLWIKHMDDVNAFEPKAYQTKNEFSKYDTLNTGNLSDMAMDVDETGDSKTGDHDLGQFSEQASPKIERECFNCGLNVLNENLENHLDRECQKRVDFCDACNSSVTYSQLGKHKSDECPKIERKCFDCGANVLNENIQNHEEVECQKRVVLCEACKSAMSYDELSDHDQECLEKSVVCDDCEGEVLRKDQSKHASECPMRAVCCENCDGLYLYSLEKKHREQCEKKKLACEYCTLELKGNDEKKAHLETCEEALIGCAFKEFGCNEKAPRKEMQVHEKHPHNALLNQVILGLQERIENLERPLTALVKKLRNPDSVGTSQ